MYISHIRLDNIRGFSGRRNVDLTLTRPDGSHAGWTVLAGRNGSGKTSLLRAIAFAVGGPNATAALNQDFRTWIASGQRRALSEIRLLPVGLEDGWTNKANVSVKDLTVNLTWTVAADRTSSRPGGVPSLAASTTPDVGMDGPWDANPWGWFCAAYGPFRRLVGGSSDAQRLMATPGPVARVASLFHEDASLTEGVLWLIDTHLRALEGKPGAAELKDLALQVLGDGMLPDHYRISDIDSDGLWVISGGHRFPLREMSDGYRSVAALVVDLLKQLWDSCGELPFEIREGKPVITTPGVVMIDEAEAHLHVTWQQKIGGWLKAHFPNVQFIVTTHSPYICQAADSGGLIRLPGPYEDEPPRVVEPDLYARVVYGSGDDAVLSELFGLESPYSDQAEKLRQELVLLEAKVISGQASATEIDDYQALRRRLTSSPVARADEIAARLRLPRESGG